MFFTAFTAWINYEKMILTYTTAGHPSQYLISPAKKDVIRLKNKGIPLCINYDTIYEESEVAIQTGDRLIMFTDGIFECLDDDGNKFDEIKLKALLMNNMNLEPEKLKQKIVNNIGSCNDHGSTDSPGLIDDTVFIAIEL
jgi:serine phosphatase RsbU (regulator of sigma subunit)